MYVPIMKNRTVEVSVLQELSKLHVFGDSIIPLVEIIQEKTRSNNKNTLLQDLLAILSEEPSMKVMVDFYKSTKLRNTTDAIREYVTMSVRYPSFPIEQIATLQQCERQVIPVISYLPENVSLERITYEETQLRSFFPCLAFRVRIQEFDTVFSHVETLIKPPDFVILDIDSASHMNPVFKKIYKRIDDSKRTHGFVSIVVSAHRPDNLANKDMEDGEPIAQIDNSLMELYSTAYMNRFSGFGDYACIAASLPSTGGAISPVGIYYSLESNFFIAYRGRAPLLSEFPEYITPRIIESEYWKEFSEEHHLHCPGCHEIMEIFQGRISGKNQAQWKKITMLHYIYTMYEREISQ